MADSNPIEVLRDFFDLNKMVRGSSEREDKCLAALDELATALEAAREDAEDAGRYRRFRDDHLWTLTSGSDGTRLSVYMPGVSLTAIGPDADEFDAAIDAARKEAP